MSKVSDLRHIMLFDIWKMYVWKTNFGWGRLTEFCFDMVVEAPVLLKMWYNDLDGDHIRIYNKYVEALT